MVKNTIGGKKGKMLSKKQHSATDSGFPVSTNENEIYVYVTKIFGGGVFEAVDSRNITYKAYLRGKMKGSNKRHNIVTIHSLLLVGIRADFTDKNSVDILFVYDHNHLISISLLPNIQNHIKPILNKIFGGVGNDSDNYDNLFGEESEKNTKIMGQAPASISVQIIPDQEDTFDLSLI